MTIPQLKQYGHELLSRYQELAGVDAQKAYYTLGARMNGKSPHFHAMKEKKHLMLAIGMLKKMIYKLENPLNERR